MPVLTLNGRACRIANIFCIGRNFVAHAAELGNPVEPEPLVFLKPTSALLLEGSPVVLPDYSRDVHHECELVVLIGRGGDHIAEADALQHVAGYGIGLDLTARDAQNDAKQKGHPWTKAKGFRGAACLSALVPAERVPDPQALTFSLKVNGETRQEGDTSLMLFGVARLIAELSARYGLTEGDLIYTGTPAGVSAIGAGDVLELELDGLVSARWEVAA
ncbi:fumarylacetoacetate hydrolase family protein [Crenobacter cavernae]|uniref:FAA hydrolase family protein n=1 Tax=Crenobacter cavernae TaxID=2290923 RepID=A0ABY0FDM8_9NEIS|nr:fumarylacetoacetate hydrolase family protein [Crenobacter cavernae]RXZ44209.1 FAA hydrolase family protein [Crenobacter cavernae]